MNEWTSDEVGANRTGTEITIGKLELLTEEVGGVVALNEEDWDDLWFPWKFRL